MSENTQLSLSLLLLFSLFLLMSVYAWQTHKVRKIIAAIAFNANEETKDNAKTCHTTAPFLIILMFHFLRVCFCLSLFLCICVLLGEFYTLLEIWVLSWNMIYLLHSLQVCWRESCTSKRENESKIFGCNSKCWNLRNRTEHIKWAVHSMCRQRWKICRRMYKKNDCKSVDTVFDDMSNW